MPGSGHALIVQYGFGGLPGILLGGAYLLSIFAGCYGMLVDSPASVQAVIGFTIVSLLWNSAFIIAGLVGLIARWFRAPRTEIIAVELIAAVMDMWGILVFFGPQSDQAGFALIMVSLLLYGWAAGTRAYLDRTETVSREMHKE